MKKLIFSILLVFQSSILFSQKIDINLVDTEVYPRNKVYTTVVDAKGEVICKLEPEDFRLTEYGQPRKLRVLSGEATETSIVALLDNSGSMDAFIKNVREAAKLFIQLLGGTDRACTYAFDHEVQHLCSTIDVSVGKNKTFLMKSLDKYRERGGGTAMYDAIDKVIQNEMVTEKDRRKAIVALTDGVSSGSLQTALDATSKHNVAVYSIGMGGVDDKALQELSNKSGGKFYKVSAQPTKEELIEVYRDIKNRLNCQYTLIYDTPEICPDGSKVPIEVFVDKYGISKKGAYTRPYHLARIPLNLFFAPKAQPRIIAIPDDPIECETVQFHTQIQATSCSDSLVLKNVVVRAYDMKPGDRIEVAKSKPVQIQSNSKPKKAIVEWDTRGFTDEHTIELVIDPVDSVLEINEEDNLRSTKIKISKAIHDFYIESIDYSPKPGSPCEMVTISVKIGDGCTCKGVKSHEIMVEAYDKGQTFGSSIVSVTSGNLSIVKFDWDPQGFFGHKPLTFTIDPQRKFGQEQTRENNKMQALIEVSPVLHELKPTEVTHDKKRSFVGDKVRFNVKVENGGICPGLPMKQNIRIRLKDVKSNRVLAHSAPFSVETQSNTNVSAEWETKRNDFGSREIEFTVDAEGIAREQTPPGKTNNSIKYKIEILPMPHDLIIKSATITPEKPVDGDPATLKVIVEDQARFPGVALKGVCLKAFERYTKALLGKSVPTDMVSQQTSSIQFDIDTGGLAGNRDILIIVDPDDKIEELTPQGLDGENNNEFILKVIILE